MESSDIILPRPCVHSAIFVAPKLSTIINALAYWAHSEVSKKIRYCLYNLSSLLVSCMSLKVENVVYTLFKNSLGFTQLCRALQL